MTNELNNTAALIYRLKEEIEQRHGGICSSIDIISNVQNLEELRNVGNLPDIVKMVPVSNGYLESIHNESIKYIIRINGTFSEEYYIE